jgi:hypothetical protein
MVDVGIFNDHFVYFTAIWYILLPFGTFYCHLVHFVVIWYIFSRFGLLHRVKSGNPAGTLTKSLKTFLKKWLCSGRFVCGVM